MKNIHILSTDKPSRLVLDVNKNLSLAFNKSIEESAKHKKNIYITSDEEIKEGDWYISILENEVYKATKETQNIMSVANLIGTTSYKKTHFKIILTTDQDLIKDGIQAIDDDFLEWFVKNPSCESVEVEKTFVTNSGLGHLEHAVLNSDFKVLEVFANIPQYSYVVGRVTILNTYEYVTNYKIIIPQEEPKQLFTDHPITELGDKEFVEAPIRECELLSFDDNKYCYVKVEGIEKEIKRCYIYPQKGRYGDVDCVSIEEIKELLKEEPKQDEHYLDSYGCTKNEFELSLNFKKEEPKQETLEEFAKRIANDSKHSGIKLDYQDGIYYGIEIGAKEQAKRMYSEEEVYNLLYNLACEVVQDYDHTPKKLDKWFEQFKKK